MGRCSEQAGDRIPFAGLQFLQSFERFLRATVGLRVFEKAFECVHQREGRLAPSLPENALGLAFAPQLPGLQTDEDGHLSVAADDDGGLVVFVADDHGRIVPVPRGASRASGLGFRHTL